MVGAPVAQGERTRDRLVQRAVPRIYVRVARTAFVLYLALSLLLYGHGAIAHPDSVCACSGDGDPTSFMWTFEWWPHAISHGLNPFVAGRHLDA